MIVGLISDHTQQMKRVKVLGLRSEYFFIESLCLRQLSFLVERDSLL